MKRALINILRRLPVAGFPALAAVMAALTGAPARASGEAPQAFPVSVPSCERDVVIPSRPKRAIAHGSNLTEMMLVLGLQERMLGYMGRPLPAGDPDDALAKAAQNLRWLQRAYPTLEGMLALEPDFVFSGWSYGMRVGGEVTPASLGRYGVPVYELSESCIRLGKVVEPTFDYLFRDIRNLGVIFGVPARAEALVAGWTQRLDVVAQRVAGKPRPRVFIYDSGDKFASTAGKYAMPQAIVTAAGGVNIAEDIASSWTRMAWETMVERAPEAIVIVDYGETTAGQKIALLRNNPAFRTVPAIRDGRFLTLSYDALTPGPRNVDAVEKLAAFLHGQRQGRENGTGAGAQP